MFQTNLPSRLDKAAFTYQTLTHHLLLSPKVGLPIWIVITYKNLGSSSILVVHWGSLHVYIFSDCQLFFLLLSLEALVQYLLDTGFMTSARDAIAPAIARQVPLTTANHKIAWCEKMDVACLPKSCVCVCCFFLVLVGCTVDEGMLANKVTENMMVKLK